MDSNAGWTVSLQILAGLGVGFFGYMGYRRGINRELFQIIGTAVAIWLSSRVAPAMQGQVNKLYKLVRLAISGGLTSDDPAAAWQEIRELPPLIETPADVQMLGLVVFVLVVSYFYVMGQRQFANPGSPVLKILGAFAGIINGFLLSYYLFPIVFTAPEAVIRLPSQEVQQTLTDAQTIARMVAFFVFVLIAFGLYSASAPKERS